MANFQNAGQAIQDAVDLDKWAQPTTFAFAFLGILWLTSKIFSFWRLIASLFILPGVSLRKFGPKGSWAVITGASDGIGKEFALQLAAKGFNVLLVSRTQSKLESLATEISQKYKVQTKIYTMDYSANQDSDFAALKKLAESLDISILINNVGQSHNMPVSFIETTEKEMRDIITINVMGTLRTTQAIAPAMVQRKRGLILTMASFGGLIPSPLLATYSGSKAFLQQWSSALASELSSSNVQVQLVQSYMVISAMSKIRRSSASTPTPKVFVRAALSKIGRSGGAQGIAATSTPYWFHGIMHWALVTFIGPMNSFTTAGIRRLHEDIRRRALRKAEREAKKSS